MSPSPRFANEIARLMRDPDSMRDEWERMQRSGRPRLYDPQQPRVPAGHSDGGQWTHTGRGAGTRAHERPQIEYAGLTGAGLADVVAGHVPIERVQAKPNQRRAPNPIELVDAARLGLYNELTVNNGPNQQTIVEFRAAQYGRKAVGIEFVRVLSRDEVAALCDRFGEVQSLTDNAVAAVKASGVTMSPQQFGTAVHMLIKEQIDKQKDPYFKAEISFLKGREDDYGVKGTIRIDALGRVRKRPDSACIYDVKTGKGGLTFPRMLEMAVNTQLAFNGAIRRFVVTEVRPSR